MKRLRKNIFVAAAGLMLVMQIQTARAQITPGALRDTAMQSELMRRTLAFDSLLLVNVSSFWEDDHTISGYGFIDSGPFYVNIRFKEKKDTMWCLEYKSLHKRKIKNAETMKAAGSLQIGILSTFEQDSAELKNKPEKIIVMSDGPEWSLMIIDHKTHVMKLFQSGDELWLYKENQRGLMYGLVLQTQDLVSNKQKNRKRNQNQ